MFVFVTEDLLKVKDAIDKVCNGDENVVKDPCSTRLALRPISF